MKIESVKKFLEDKGYAHRKQRYINYMKKGEKYNRLTAVRFDHRDKYSSQYWLFKCDCGNKKVMKVSRVKRGDAKSCGCFQKERVSTHKMSYTREYHSWAFMKERCFNKKHISYKNYGDRGITICKRWLGKNGFQNFYADMGERPGGKSLDRTDNNKGYKPSNCRWATPKQQNNNSRRNIFVSINNVQIPFSELAEMFGINYEKLYRRLYEQGWSLKKALNQ